MSKPTEYLMPQKIVALIEDSKSSLHMLRLFHACYAYVDKNPLMSVGVIGMTGKPACTASCSDLAALTGSPSGKSNAWIKNVVKEFDEKSLFSKLELNESGTLLSFKFSPRVGPASLRNIKTPFAMMDVDDVATISSASELLFYTLAKLVYNASQPLFYLPHIDPETNPWTDDRKKSWLRVAARVGMRLDQHYLIFPKHDPCTRKTVRVRVNVVTKQSQWSAGRLYPQGASAAVSVVHGGEYRSLKRAELLSRKAWTRVATPC